MHSSRALGSPVSADGLRATVTPFCSTGGMTDGGAGAAGGLVGAADRLVAEEAVGDGEYLALLCKQRARLDARIALETAAFDASGAWADDGARTAATWVARRCRLPKAEAKAQVRLGRHLRHLPVARAAFLPRPRVEVSETQRFFTGALRRAIVLRDRRCTHPMCDRLAEDCEVDHIVPFSEGGLTVQDNGRLLCPFHNHMRNQRKERPPPDTG